MRILTLLTIITISSCRSNTDYKALPNKLTDANNDTTISATARMWQGQYEYLAIEIEIKRTDSLFVNSIAVTPKLGDEKFFPWFDNFEMYSYYYEKEGKYKGGPYWKAYFADTFDKLPTENRQTNKNRSFIKFTAHYNSERAIKFKYFSADIEVQLIDKLGQLIKLNRHNEFYGEREGHFSVH